MKASIITVGDELLVGQVVNTNASWLGRRLTEIGMEVHAVTTVGDSRDAIQDALKRAIGSSSIVVISGGLGSTHDDITRKTVAAWYGVESVFDEAVFTTVRDRFRKRNLSMPPSNHSQALIPEGFEPLPNPIGTAPGLRYTEARSTGPFRLVLLPGVPEEMQAIMEDSVLPELRTIADANAIRQITLLTAGIGETRLAALLRGADELLDENLRLAFLPGVQSVRLRLTAFVGRDAEAEERLNALEALIHDRASAYLYGTGEETLEEIIGRRFSEADATLAVAESCTGGLLAHRLTNVPGSSGYFLGGIVAYADLVKLEQIGVATEVLSAHGAVSREVALEMAVGVRRLMHATVALSTTGVMGPSGGSSEKPVGTVWIAMASDRYTRVHRIRLGSERLRNKEGAATVALNLLRRWLQDMDILHVAD